MAPVVANIEEEEQEEDVPERKLGPNQFEFEVERKGNSYTQVIEIRRLGRRKPNLGGYQNL
jgi:hypothetical protein